MGLLKHVVHNESMKNDPPEIYGWRIWVVAVSACFGGMLFGWDIGAIGGILIMPSFQKKYGLPTGADAASKKVTADLTANIVSTLQGGCFFGALAAYYFADKWGRRISLLVAATITIIGIIIQTASFGSVDALYVGRVIAGVGVGAASMLTPLYVSENAPRAIRGGMTGCYQLFLVTGIMMAFWVNFASNKHSKGDSRFLAPLALQALPALILLIGIFFCTESARFLAKKDDWEGATNVLTRIRNLPADHPYIRMELDEMAQQLQMERELIGGSSFMDLQKEMWLIPSNRKRALISIGLMIMQQMTGTNAINYYSPAIFLALGVKGPNNGLFATGIYGLVKVIACAIFLLFVADSLGRRKSLLLSSIGQGVSMFIIGFYVRFFPPKADQPIPGFGYFALACIFIFAVFFQFGWGPVCWILVSEIPTARLRAMNVAIAAATQWLFNFVVAQAVPHMMRTVGRAGYGTYFIFGSFCFSMFVFTWFLIPETKGLSLEKMDALFGLVHDTKVVDEERNSPSTSIHEKDTHTKTSEISTEKDTTSHVERK